MATIVALLVVGLIAFAGVTALTTRNTAIANELIDLTRLSQILAEHTQRVMFGADLISSSFEERVTAAEIRSPEEFKRRFATKEVHAALQAQIIHTTDVDALTLVDRNGLSINSSRYWPPSGRNISDRDYFLALRDSPGATFVISPALTNRVTGQQTIFFARRINGRDGEFAGLVLATIATSRFEKLFAAVLPSDQASIALYRRDGALLVRQPEPAGEMEATEINKFLQETLSRAEQGAKALTVGDPPQLMALHAVRGYPLAIYVTNSVAVVLAEWQRFVQLIFAFAGAAIALVVLLGFAFVRQWKLQVQVVEAADRLARTNEELTAANKDLESFSYSISHDLRAPARAMAGLTRVVVDDYGTQLPEEGRRLLLRISKAGTDMGAMVDGLLKLSQISRAELQRRPVDLAALAADVWQDLVAAEPERRVALHLNGEVRARGDPVLLRNLMINLLDNARKYAQNRPDASVWLGRRSDGAYFVRDNGVGFDMAHAAKLFDAFQRLHTSPDFHGHGIGLALCKRIVDRHGGDLWAESAVGEGATFYFTLGKAA